MRYALLSVSALLDAPRFKTIKDSTYWQWYFFFVHEKIFSWACSCVRVHSWILSDWFGNCTLLCQLVFLTKDYWWVLPSWSLTRSIVSDISSWSIIIQELFYDSSGGGGILLIHAQAHFGFMGMPLVPARAIALLHRVPDFPSCCSLLIWFYAS